MQLNRLKIITLAVLASLDLAAALFVWRSFAAAGQSESLPSRSASIIVPVALSDAPAAAEGDDHDTLARPLFVKSRRPSQNAAPVATGATLAPPPAGLKLHAVIGFNHLARAFVTSTAAAEGKWLSVGETFEDWKVDSIAAQDIALRQDADVFRVGFVYDDAPNPAAPAPAPPPPPKADSGNETPAARIVAPDAFDAVKGAKRGGH
jgi:hypothetical protein